MAQDNPSSNEAQGSHKAGGGRCRLQRRAAGLALASSLPVVSEATFLSFPSPSRLLLACWWQLPLHPFSSLGEALWRAHLSQPRDTFTEVTAHVALSSQPSQTWGSVLGWGWAFAPDHLFPQINSLSTNVLLCRCLQTRCLALQVGCPTKPLLCGNAGGCHQSCTESQGPTSSVPQQMGRQPSWLWSRRARVLGPS